MKSPYSPQYAVDVNQDCSNNTTPHSHMQTHFYGNQLDNAHQISTMMVVPNDSYCFWADLPLGGHV